MSYTKTLKADGVASSMDLLSTPTDRAEGFAGTIRVHLVDLPPPGTTYMDIQLTTENVLDVAAFFLTQTLRDLE